MLQAYCPLCGDPMTEVDNVRAVTVRPLVGAWQNMFFAHQRCLDGAINTMRFHWHAEEKEQRRKADGEAP